MASVTLDVIMRLVDQTSSKLQTINAALNATNAQGAKTNTTMQALQSGLKGITLFAVYEGIKQVGEAFYEVAKQGAQFERAMTSFQAMTALSGEQYTEVLGDMRAATRGTVSDMDLMISANKALSLGVANSSAELAKLVETSTVLGRRTGLGQEQALERLMVGIGRLSPRILDDLGIAVNLTRLYREETGKTASELDQATKIHVLMTKVLEDGQKVLEQYPQGLEDTASGFERLTAARKNYMAELGQSAPVEGTANWLDDRSQNMVQNRIISNAREGKASIEELTQAIKFETEAIQASVSPYNNAASSAGEYNARLQDLNKALESAQYNQVEWNRMQNMIAATAPPVPDWGKQTEGAGKSILYLMDLMDTARTKFDSAQLLGNTQGMAAAQADIATYAATIEHLVFLYNEAAEELGLPLMDKNAAMAGVLAEMLDPEPYDVLSTGAEKAKEEIKALEEAMKASAAAGAEAAQVYQKILGSKRDAMGGDIVNLLASDSSAGAMDAAMEARQRMESQMHRVAEAGMSEEEQMIATTRAYLSGKAVIDEYVKSKEKLAQDKAANTLQKTGDQIRELTSVIFEANSVVGGSTADASLKAAGGLTAVQEELRRLGEAYNAAAAIAGLPLIDVDALTRGEIKAYDASAALNVLNDTQGRVKTMAEIAAGALDMESVALGVLESAVAGYQAKIISTVLAGGDVFGVDTQVAAIHNMSTEVQTAVRDILASEDDEITKMVKVEAAIRGTTDAYSDSAQAIRAAHSEAEKYAETLQGKLKSAMDAVNNVAGGALKDSLNELSKVGIGEDDYAKVGARSDVPAENARRLGALMVEGVKDQPWLAEFIAEAPETWNEYITAADPAGAAGRMLQEFQKGLRPELIDFGQLKDQIREKLETQFRLEDMGAQLSAELIAEMGTSNSTAIQRLVGEALGTGVEDSPFAADASARLLSQFQSVDFAEQMKTAGGVSAMNWALGFNNDVPEYMLPFIDILASYVLPIVQANIVATAVNTGAK